MTVMIQCRGRTPAPFSLYYSVEIELFQDVYIIHTKWKIIYSKIYFLCIYFGKFLHFTSHFEKLI